MPDQGDAEILLGALLKRVASFKLDGIPVLQPNNTLRGLEKLPLRVRLTACIKIDRRESEVAIAARGVRVVEGSWEGWKWMELSEFLQQVSIETWNERYALVAMVLPPARREAVQGLLR
jgi:hypothetical protein